MEQTKIRQSNMELLRIIAMILVLALHVNYLALGAPSIEEIKSSPLSSFFRIEFEAMALVCVNVFVLISGYFGIKPKFKSIANFIFQIVFFQFVIYIAFVGGGRIEFSWYGFIKNILPQKMWFIWAYLGLMLLAPVLNKFIDYATKEELRNYLFVFFVLQTVFGYLSSYWSWYTYGYSTISFIGLYMLTRYIRLYSPQWTMLNGKVYLLGYFIITSAAAIFVFVMCRFINNELIHSVLYNHFVPYTSVQTILGSVFSVSYTHLTLPTT